MIEYLDHWHLVVGVPKERLFNIDDGVFVEGFCGFIGLIASGSDILLYLLFLSPFNHLIYTEQGDAVVRWCFVLL